LTPNVAGVDARLHTESPPRSGRSRRLSPGVAVVLAATAAAIILAACGNGGNSNINLNSGGQHPATNPTATRIHTIPGMPAVVNPTNLYSQTRAGQFSPATKGALNRVYVPNLMSNDVYVIDPRTFQVVDRFPVGVDPQHVVPSYDLKTLWVANEAVNRTDGTVIPVNPKTGKPGAPIAVDNPYNLYFTADGKSVIVVAEQRKRLDFRDPHTFALQQSVPLDNCAGNNHADFSIDGTYLIISCEFQRGLAKVDVVHHQVLGYLQLAPDAVPQDVRVGPDGKTFYVADLNRGGLWTVDGSSFTETGFIPTAVGAHGLVISRDTKKMYVANRGNITQSVGPGHGPGSVSVLDFATNRIVATWSIPGGGSPDMGGITADGTQLWVSGRFDNVVYVFNTKTGAVRSIPVGREPHGVAVWPQPGRYSLGHVGVMR
jgi:YVTN family beta-propeller protein